MSSIRTTPSKSCLTRCSSFGGTRDVFLLNHIEALDYALIARHLGLSVADVQARLGDALCELSRTVDLIERVRPKLINPSNAEHPDV